MTLVSYTDGCGERKAHCQWFERPGELGEGFFLDAELTAYQPARSADQLPVIPKAARVLLQIGGVLAVAWLVRIVINPQSREERSPKDSPDWDTSTATPLPPQGAARQSSHRDPTPRLQ